MDRITIICPCCEANIQVDGQTGAVISHSEKTKAVASFDALRDELGKQKELRDSLFNQEMSSMKDRERLLDEKFREAMKRADVDKDKPFRNPLDMD